MKCQECQLVKAEHQHPMGLLQLLPIPKWKWEVISMEFIIGLPKSKKQNYAIFVFINNLSKESHFIPIKSTYKTMNIVDIFLKQIFRLHGIPKVIISDQDVKFIRNFWRPLFSRLEIVGYLGRPGFTIIHIPTIPLAHWPFRR